MDSVDKSIQVALKMADHGTRDETKTAISMIKLSFHSYLKSMNEYIEAMDKFNKSAVAPSPKKNITCCVIGCFDRARNASCEQRFGYIIKVIFRFDADAF